METNITHLLHQIVYVMDEIAEKKLLENFSLNYSEYLILNASGDIGSTTQKEISEWTNFSKAKISKLIFKMGKKKLVTAEISKQDRRQNALRLTGKGKRLQKKTNSYLEKIFIDEIVVPTNIDKDLFHKNLQNLLFNLNNYG